MVSYDILSVTNFKEAIKVTINYNLPCMQVNHEEGRIATAVLFIELSITLVDTFKITAYDLEHG